ncbi:hypothetical protein RJ639_038372 [Escallonia herrerae]|uniref:Uncharacterized protein n=1 Tax=Escallonia herrerae TaxID=1293975 RepID=A0AA88WNS0_9ASTE|nr:hypothetical protein RJ639_038372 [Escallonia herrerae]
MLRHCSGDGRKREREREAPRVSKSPKITEHGGSSPEVSPAPDGRPKAIFILDGAAVKKTLVRKGVPENIVADEIITATEFIVYTIFFFWHSDCLETAAKKWRILSSEENADIFRRQKKNLDDYRPDILFEALRGIHDSPLYKAGMVGVMVRGEVDKQYADDYISVRNLVKRVVGVKDGDDQPRMAKRKQQLKRKAGDGNVSGEGDLTTKRRQNSLVLQPCSGKALEHEVGNTKESEERQDYMLDPVDLEMQKKVDELPGIPLVPSNHNKEPGVIFVLEKASLVPAYVGRKYQILNPDEHAEFLRKKKLNPYDYRPDIIHEPPIVQEQAGGAIVENEIT